MSYKSAFSLFNDSKEAVFNSPWPFLWIIFIPSFLIVVGEAMNGGQTWLLPQTAATPSDASQSLQMIGGLLSLLLLPAGFYVELMAAKRKTLTVSEIIGQSMRFYWRTIGLVILMTIIIALGIIAFIVPGLIFIHRFFLAPYFLIDRDLGIREAMSVSWNSTKGKAGLIWSVIGVIILLSLFNIIPIFGGLISAILLTLYTCAPAFRYSEIANKK